MEKNFFSTLIFIFFCLLLSAQNDSIIYLNKSHNSIQVQPNYIIDYLKIPNEFFKSFELNKTDIKRIKTKDNTILIQTHLLIIFNDTLLKTAKDKKNRLSNIFPNEIISIKRLNSIEKFERFKDFKNKEFIEIKTMSCPEISLQKTKNNGQKK